MIGLIPAYGRDYKSVAEVTKAFNENKDFKIADVSCRWDGSYCNKQQLIRDYDKVQIRYDGLRKVAIIEVN